MRTLGPWEIGGDTSYYAGEMRSRYGFYGIHPMKTKISVYLQIEAVEEIFSLN